jgi:hypothetical protein
MRAASETARDFWDSVAADDEVGFILPDRGGIALRGLRVAAPDILEG